MSRLADLKQRLAEYRAAEATANALEDLSALKLQSIRSGFEKNRTFYGGMRELYGTVRAFAGKEGQPRNAAKARQLFVAITSNKRFYGALMRNIVARLSRSLEGAPGAGAIIVGRAGWQHAEEIGLTKKARQVILADDMPTSEEFEMLLSLTARYERVFVLYPKFVNAFRQDVAIEDITQSPEPVSPTLPSDTRPAAFKLATAAAGISDGRDAGFIFEPEVPAILAFFKAQVQRLLFQGVLLEAELARTAARLVRLEEAEERAHVLATKAGVQVRREIAAVSNAALLETFAGLTAWNRV